MCETSRHSTLTSTSVNDNLYIINSVVSRINRKVIELLTARVAVYNPPYFTPLNRQQPMTSAAYNIYMLRFVYVIHSRRKYIR